MLYFNIKKCQFWLGASRFESKTMKVRYKSMNLIAPHNCTTVTALNRSSISSFPTVNTDGLANTVGVNVNIGIVNRQGDRLSMPE